MSDLKNREAFEREYSERFPHDKSTLLKSGNYSGWVKQESWEMWQASTQREGLKFVPLEPSEEMYSDLSRHLCRYMQMKDRYCPKTLGDYIKRYIGFKNIPQWLNDEVGDWDSTHAFATADLGVFIYKAMINAV